MIDPDALIALQDASFARAESGLRASWAPAAAMDGVELLDFLASHRYCVLATATARGRPVARPVAFTVVGSAFWFATVAGGRLRNVTRTPWVSIVVAEGDAGAHRAVAVDGPARLVGRPPDDVLAAWDDKHESTADWAAAWFEVRPERLMSYSARRD